MSDVKRDTAETTPDPAIVETEENREAAREGESPQEFRSDREPAESHTTFGDDKVTPRLNDGR